MVQCRLVTPRGTGSNPVIPAIISRCSSDSRTPGLGPGGRLGRTGHLDTGWKWFSYERFETNDVDIDDRTITKTSRVSGNCYP